MYRPPRLRARHLTSLVLLAACGRSHAAERSFQDPPPRAEFLMVGNDSTFWVSTLDGGTRVRGEPLVLARYGGRWYEVYSADDDRSYDDAMLVGTRLYRRDIQTGDSAIVFADTTVPRIADAYARSHPDARPLTPDEDGEPDPSQQATAELDVLDVFGPYLSYEYRVDVSTRGGLAWRSTRRGVIDLRSGKSSSVADVFGSGGDRAVASGRRAFQTMRDSVLRVAQSLDADERRAAAVLTRQRFDDRSFSLTTLDGHAAVAFQIPGRGAGPEGNGFELEPVVVLDTTWSPEPASSRASTDSTGTDHWDGPNYRIIARYDTSGGVANLSVADPSRREWPLGSIGAPVHRVDWLDRPPVNASDRQALVRAFNTASTYGEPSHVAMLGRQNLQLARHETSQGRLGKPARVVGADVAPAREQHGARIRWRGSFDDGQDSRDRRVQAQQGGGRHGLDRPRRLSRTDPLGRFAGHESQRQLGRTHVDGGGSARGSRRTADRQAAPH
jgi:hypothetical protein